MKTSSVLTRALCLSTCASAFYIWEPHIQDGSCIEKSKSYQFGIRNGERSQIKSFPITQRARPGSSNHAASRISPYGRIGHERLPEKRSENDYDILKANNPSYPHTEGVNQDGDDLSYFISISVGSAKKEMYMLIDTGAGSTWIMGNDCSTDACNMHNTFSQDTSDTISTTNSHFSISYGSGSVTGQAVTDTLTVGDISVNMTFGLANYTSTDFESFPFDGILGLSLNKGSTDSFTQKLRDSDSVSVEMFSIFLARANSGINNGELTIGGINPDRYEGDITYTPLTSKTSGDWLIPMDGISIDGNDIGITGRNGYIDTGTSYIFGPPDDVKTLHEKIDGAASTDNSRWSVPCNTNHTLSISFGGTPWILNESDWISSERDDSTCYSYIMGIEVVKGGWLLGDAFIKNVYSVFDMKNRRIGFAKAKQQGGSATSTGSSGSTSATTALTGGSSHETTIATTQTQQSSTTKSAGVSFQSAHGLIAYIFIAIFITLL